MAQRGGRLAEWLLAALVVPAAVTAALAGAPARAQPAGDAGLSALPAAALRDVQSALQGLGYDPGPVDGMAGRSTLAAARRFCTVVAPACGGTPEGLHTAVMVARIQALLGRLGFDAGGITGQWSPATQNATARFCAGRGDGCGADPAGLLVTLTAAAPPASAETPPPKPGPAPPPRGEPASAALASAPPLPAHPPGSTHPATTTLSAPTLATAALGLTLAAGLLVAWRLTPARRRRARATAARPRDNGAPQGRAGAAREPISIVRPTLAANVWACRHCGTNNLGGSACVVCDRPRNGG